MRISYPKYHISTLGSLWQEFLFLFSPQNTTITKIKKIKGTHA